MLNELLDVFGPEGARRTYAIPRESVDKWATSDDIEVLGALCALLDNVTFLERVRPPLSPDAHQELFLRYLKRCFLENPQGDWADTRYQAGWSLVSWFKSLWADSAIPRVKLLEIKHFLADLYSVGDDDVKKCVVNSVLEHLFEDPRIARYFHDWHKDPKLQDAYSSAKHWTKRGGTSPL